MRAPLHARSPPDALSGGQATPQSPSLDPGSPCTCCPAASITVAWIPSLQGLSGFPTTPEFKVLGLPTPPHSAPAAAHRLTPHSQLSLCVCTLPACEGLGPALHSCWAPATLIWGSHVPSPCGAFIPAAPSAWISSYNCRRWETGRPHLILQVLLKPSPPPRHPPRLPSLGSPCLLPQPRTDNHTNLL